MTSKYTVTEVLEELNNKLKIRILGDGAIGKTCMLMVYALKTFPTEYVPTVYDNYYVNLNIQKQKVEVELVDFAQNEDIFTCYPNLFHAHGYILCYDVANPSSFRNVRELWVPELKQKESVKVPIVLVGTKYDLRERKEESYFSLLNFVNISEVKRYAQIINSAGPIECSALKNKNISQVIEVAIKKAISDRQELKFNYCNIL